LRVRTAPRAASTALRPCSSTEILTCADIRIAGDGARFGLAEVKWSLFPMGGSTVRLPRQISYCNAMEILLTGEQLSAERALQMGLINKVVPPAEMLPEAMRFARILCETGPLAVQAVKRSVVEGLALPPEQALEREMELGFPVSMSEDCREGT
jgi:enoyl-CoA hydratase